MSDDLLYQGNIQGSPWEDLVEEVAELSASLDDTNLELESASAYLSQSIDQKALALNARINILSGSVSRFTGEMTREFEEVKEYVDEGIASIPVIVDDKVKEALELVVEEGEGERSVQQRGTGAEAIHDSEVAFGTYNKSNDATRFSIGVGTSEESRKNAIEVVTSGDVFIQGIGNYDGTNASTTPGTLQKTFADLKNDIDCLKVKEYLYASEGTIDINPAEENDKPTRYDILSLSARGLSTSVDSVVLDGEVIGSFGRILDLEEDIVHLNQTGGDLSKVSDPSYGYDSLDFASKTLRTYCKRINIAEFISALPNKQPETSTNTFSWSKTSGNGRLSIRIGSVLSVFPELFIPADSTQPVYRLTNLAENLSSLSSKKGGSANMYLEGFNGIEGVTFSNYSQCVSWLKEQNFEIVFKLVTPIYTDFSELRIGLVNTNFARNANESTWIETDGCVQVAWLTTRDYIYTKDQIDEKLANKKDISVTLYTDGDPLENVALSASYAEGTNLRNLAEAIGQNANFTDAWVSFLNHCADENLNETVSIRKGSDEEELGVWRFTRVAANSADGPEYGATFVYEASDIRKQIEIHVTRSYNETYASWLFESATYTVSDLETIDIATLEEIDALFSEGGGGSSSSEGGGHSPTYHGILKLNDVILDDLVEGYNGAYSFIGSTLSWNDLEDGGELLGLELSYTIIQDSELNTASLDDIESNGDHEARLSFAYGTTTITITFGEDGSFIVNDVL